jgi:hypothetical protein
MTTVTQLIEYLQTLPADASVTVPTEGSRDWQDLIIPAKDTPYSSNTCWYDDYDNELKLGE